MKIFRYMTLAVLLAPFSIQAANINVWHTPLNSGPFEIGDTVSVDIMGSWDESVYAGSFKLEFDENVLSWTNTVSHIWAAPTSGEMVDAGVVQAVAGDFANYQGGIGAGTYHVATVNFTAQAGGISHMDLAPLSLQEQTTYEYYGWYANNGAGSETHYPVFDATGTVTVNPVPLPAAAWFMLSGLGFLAFRRKRAA